MPERTHPIEGQVILLAGAKASVTLKRLSALLEDVQRHLVGRYEEYGRRFERIEADGRTYYLADTAHWDGVGRELGFEDSETDGVRRAHGAQFRRDGRRLDRLGEFEAAMEVRDPVTIAPP
ncbi:MAG: hypothetical protein ACI9HI_001293 [Salinirussus sp.]|jgi:hypothetical protein